MSKPEVQLYEFTAIISRAVVVAATSKEEAHAVISSWEQAWEENSDFIGVSDVDLSDVRPLKSSDWRDEAHVASASVPNDEEEATP